MWDDFEQTLHVGQSCRYSFQSAHLCQIFPLTILLLQNECHFLLLVVQSFETHFNPHTFSKQRRVLSIRYPRLYHQSLLCALQNLKGTKFYFFSTLARRVIVDVNRVEPQAEHVVVISLNEEAHWGILISQKDLQSSGSCCKQK